MLIPDYNDVDKPNGEQTFRNYMIYGGIWLLKVYEQTCYPKDHIKREDDIPIFLLILKFHNMIGQKIICRNKGQET